MTNATDWLRLTTEAAIEPELPIVDTHHHLWDRPSSRYLLDELVADLGGHNVRQTVFVECSSMYRSDGPEELRCVGETEFVQEVADQSASGQRGEMRAVTGIVGTADLRLGRAVGPVLDAHLEASPQHFRGIRQRTAWAAPGVLTMRTGAVDEAGVMMGRAFRAGFAELEPRDLSFDAWLFHPQLPEVADLAGSFPNTTIILNHLGGPLGVGPYAEHRAAVFKEWRRGLARVAEHANVQLKVGGIQMPLNGFGWHERERPPSSDELLEANRDWYLAAIELFGPERCMFESNFPVDRQSCSYAVLWNQFKKLSSGFTPSERAAMFHGTAERVYRLAPR
jgi:L-fuconolactonase